MIISPILLLSLGVSFAFMYGLIITLGWAITRKNRRAFHQSVGLNEIELFDIIAWKPLNQYVKTVSLINNVFQNESGQKINPCDFKCYIVKTSSHQFPGIKEGYLIFMEPDTNNIKYAFNVPNLENYR